jgi:hypothetical protein
MLFGHAGVGRRMGNVKYEYGKDLVRSMILPYFTVLGLLAFLSFLTRVATLGDGVCGLPQM